MTKLEFLSLQYKMCG